MLERVVLPTEEDRYAQQRRQQQQQSHLSPAFAHFAGGLGFRVEGAGVGSLDSFLCRCLSYAPSGLGARFSSVIYAYVHHTFYCTTMTDVALLESWMPVASLGIAVSMLPEV